MYGRLMFVVGAGVGYVLGARAGRERYNEMRDQAQQLWHDPRVQAKVEEATSTVKEKAPEVQAKLGDLAGQPADAVKGKASELKDKAGEKAADLKDQASAKASDTATDLKDRVGSRDGDLGDGPTSPVTTPYVPPTDKGTGDPT